MVMRVTIVEVIVINDYKLVALVNNFVLVGMLIVILGFLNTQSCKKILRTAAGPLPARSRPEANRQPHGSSNVSNPRLVGRKKPYANRIRELSNV